MLYQIILSLSKFHEEKNIKNSSFKSRYEELKTLVLYISDLWNYIVYARTNTQIVGTFDPRFYYQSIILNLYVLNAVIKTIGHDFFGKDKNLKDLRDNISHIDEKMKIPLNWININDISNDTVTVSNGKTIIKKSLCGLNMDSKTGKVASPLGIVGNIIFSSLQPGKKSNYKNFVKFEITESLLLSLQSKLLLILKNYFQDLKVKNQNNDTPPFSFPK